MRLAFWRRNRFRSNTQFGSVTGAYGVGRGVLGITNAATDVTATPINSGVLYVEGETLKWRDGVGKVTQLAPLEEKPCE